MLSGGSTRFCRNRVANPLLTTRTAVKRACRTIRKQVKLNLDKTLVRAAIHEDGKGV